MLAKQCLLRRNRYRAGEAGRRKNRGLCVCKRFVSCAAVEPAGGPQSSQRSQCPSFLCRIHRKRPIDPQARGLWRGSFGMTNAGKSSAIEHMPPYSSDISVVSKFPNDLSAHCFQPGCTITSGTHSASALSVCNTYGKWGFESGSIFDDLRLPDLQVARRGGGSSVPTRHRLSGVA